jgi:hypothetical protein
MVCGPTCTRLAAQHTHPHANHVDADWQQLQYILLQLLYLLSTHSGVRRQPWGRVLTTVSRFRGDGMTSSRISVHGKGECSRWQWVW